MQGKEMIYKIWVHVEKIDEEANHYEDIGLPESLGEFACLDDALEVVENIKISYGN